MSTYNWKKYRDHTVAKIQQATVDYDPYWHVIVNDVLHPELYQLCLEKWPRLEENLQKEKNYLGMNQNRDIWNLEQDGMPFWREYFSNLIDHKEIIDAVYSYEGLDKNRCSWRNSSLWSDYKGYSVSNHYDDYTIDVAWQIYMYCDGGEKWGTSMNDEHGNELKRFPFAHNSSWLMRVDAGSWHSCREVDCNERKSIMCRFMTHSRS